MVVVGAGVIGVEIASVYRRLGSEVVVIEMLERICPAMDKAVSAALQHSLEKQGLVFYLGAKVFGAKANQGGVSLQVQTKEGNEEMKADALLVAIGRRPFTKGLGLEKIGVQTTEKGFVAVDGNFRTSVDNVFAIGDVIEGPMLAHRASEEGVALMELLAGLTPHVNYMAVPNVIYTHPEVASVGLTEEEAADMGLSIFTGMCAFKANARARSAGDTEGFVKVIGEKDSGLLIGLHIIGPNASEMIGEGVIAMEERTTVEKLAASSHAHPTLSEAIKEAALKALGRPIHL
jgi:dihydrolipoamide dehydrogenase